MEIGRIPGISPVSVLKSPPSDPRLSDVCDIEHPSEPGDDTYSGSNSAASGDDDQDEMNEAEHAEESESTDQTSSSINLLA